MVLGQIRRLPNKFPRALLYRLALVKAIRGCEHDHRNMGVVLLKQREPGGLPGLQIKDDEIRAKIPFRKRLDGLLTACRDADDDGWRFLR